jgi:hypothetical protein
MGEEQPELIEARLMTLGEAMHRLHEDGTKADLPDDALVWVVRMRGTFMPSSAPGPEYMVPEEGWSFAVINAKTGRMMGHGYNYPDTPF